MRQYFVDENNRLSESNHELTTKCDQLEDEARRAEQRIGAVEESFNFVKNWMNYLISSICQFFIGFENASQIPLSKCIPAGEIEKLETEQIKKDFRIEVDKAIYIAILLSQFREPSKLGKNMFGRTQKTLEKRFKETQEDQSPLIVAGPDVAQIKQEQEALQADNDKLVKSNLGLKQDNEQNNKKIS